MQRPQFTDVPEKRRANMQAVRGKHTKPEIRVRQLLHKAGYRFRLHVKDLPGRPDLAFPGRRKIIEIRGCFWHRHPDPNCRNAVAPQTRPEWWKEKLDANVARDQRNLNALTDLGWDTMVVWECETGNPDLLGRLQTFLGRPGPAAKDLVD